MQVTFQTPNCCFFAEFNQTAIAQIIIKNLPIDSKVETWGDEIYFKTSVSAPIAIGTTEVEIGDVAYWPQGQSICVFFGPTPLSTDQKPVPESQVLIIGKTKNSPEELRQIKLDDPIRIMPVQQPSAPSAAAKTSTSVPAAAAASAATGGYSGDRKLSQDEIDVLVQQLLAEKKKKEQEKKQ